MNTRTISLSLFTLLIGLVIAAPSARADQSCVVPLQERTAQTLPGRGWTVEMTIHRENVDSVSYTRFNYLLPDGSGGFHSTAGAQLFSERKSASSSSQPFDATQSVTTYLQLSPAGVLRIQEYRPTGEYVWTYTYWDMSCQGPVLTRYFPGYGVITLTFRHQMPFVS